MAETRTSLGDFVLVMKIYSPEIDKGIYYDVDSLQNIVIHRSDSDKKSQKTLLCFLQIPPHFSSLV